VRLGVILDHGMRSREAGRVPPVTAWMNILRSSAYMRASVIAVTSALPNGLTVGTRDMPVGGVLSGVLERFLWLLAPFLLDALDLIAVSLGALPVVNNRTVQEARIAAASAAPWASDA